MPSPSGNRTRVKICGVTSVSDAAAAVAAGADAVGLVFYPDSTRYVELKQARDIVSSLPPFVSSVALFVDPNEDQVRQVIDQVKPSLLQFHGAETAEFASQFPLPYVKAIRLGAGGSSAVAEHSRLHPDAQGFLLDTYDRNAAGGTGKKFDWSLFPPNLQGGVLAGGLDPCNVAQAIEQTGAAAVDVSSGVESSTGKKSIQLMTAFVAACQAADRRRNENETR